MRKLYWELEGFQDLYLEDSWVLDVVAQPATLRVRCNLVLRESHPLFSGPKPGEQYCYRAGTVLFDNVTELHWVDHPRLEFQAVDANGERDFGSFEVFGVEGNRYKLVGDFGAIELTSAQPTVALD